MASNYPTSLDNFSNPSGTDSLNSPSHSLQHSDINDAVEALETKIGIGDSPAGSATAGQVLTAQGGGTAIWATPALVHINTTDFSAVASQSLDDVFSATYDNYLILLSKLVTSNNTVNINGRLRVSSTDNTSNNYYRGRYFVGAYASITAGSQNNQLGSAFLFGQTSNVATGGQVIYLFQPFLTSYTSYTSHSAGSLLDLNAGSMNVTTSYTGLTFYPDSGTMTGTVRVYGYKN